LTRITCISTRELQDLVRALQFGVLLAQPPQLLVLHTGRPVAALALISLVLTHPLPQRLRTQAELVRDVLDRPAGFQHQRHRAGPNSGGYLLGRATVTPSLPLAEQDQKPPEKWGNLTISFQVK